MKWYENYQYVKENGKIIAEIDELKGGEHGYKYRAMVGEHYKCFRKLRKAKKYIEKLINKQGEIK